MVRNKVKSKIATGGRQIGLFKTSFWWTWLAYDSRGNNLAYGKNPQQALKRLKSPTCKRWFKRHQEFRRHVVRGKHLGSMWEWNQIFKTTHDDPNWDEWHGRYRK